MPESSSEAPPALEQLLKKAELQQQQLKLEVQFKKNMELMKRVIPQLYNEYHDYQPQELKLELSADGYVNLVNFKLNNKPVYSEDPVTFARKQVDAFKQKPPISIVHLQKNLDAGRFKQIELLNNMLTKHEQAINHPTPSGNDPIGLLLVTGCGLGYQLSLLLDELDVYNLCLIDPHKDSFYASLHTLDWGKILKHFAHEGRCLKLYIGQSTFNIMADMKQLADKIGLYNLSTTYVLRHFNSSEEKQFIEQYRKEFHLNAAGIGFIEDEQIGLSHTVHNLNRKLPIFNGKKSESLPPAVVVGNGPSLDANLDWLRREQDNVIIFSCGSALGTLYKAGLKPDFHIEMERTSPTADWVRENTSEAFRESIRLLILNTVSPNTVELFSNVAMAKKPNDLGSHVIDQVVGTQYPVLHLCNPTATNSGLSFSALLGFKEIYLCGVDLGMKDEKNHHAKSSVYYDMDEKAQKIISQDMQKRSYQVAGNYGGHVLTNTDLDSTRANMEILLAALRNLSVYNLNDGAKIEGAEPMQPKEVSIAPSETEKSIVIERLFTQSFDDTSNTEIMDERYVNEHVLKAFFQFRKKLALPKQIDSAKDLFDKLNKIYSDVQTLCQQHPAAGTLLRGTCNAFFTIVVRACVGADSKSSLNQAYQDGKAAYETMLDYGYELLKNNPLRIDESRDIWKKLSSATSNTAETS